MLKRLAVALTVTTALLASAVAKAETLRFGHANAPGEVLNDLFNEFAEKVKERSGGELEIQVFPSEQLGKEVDLIQQVKFGALDISAPSMPSMAGLVPALEMASTPFLWTDWAEAEEVLRGPAFEPLWDELRDQHNIVPLTKISYWGWRNFTFTDREVRKPEDMAGLKIRVPESPIWVEMIRAFGAAPTPIPFGEVYTALQQKTVDGQENPIPTIYSRKYYEVQGVLTLDRHMLQNNTVVISKITWDRLSEDHQKILREEAEAISKKNSELQQGRERDMLEEIRKSGRTKIIEDVDVEAFKAAMEPVYPQLAERWGQENWQRLQDVVAEIRKQ
ncbi:MAG TPA: TRAP transporter substrate-binding protein [Geminicoccus sp.]|uniref:TRAP transporter substrate-binding protein n=1 Tax=Geminicoccus sp. TaxID=2024832 RepID=UPI002CA2B618|nr:TRAP transporter substrate-binding protein [Geminicoccus sp.]HWL71287.1 TRAP transporter substrate-binding protein [Geminicoccus sp.]